MKKLKTGIFSGSFNPIHIGHLALANYLCEFGEVDEVWFVVSPHNPLKKPADLWPDELRLRLVQLAIGDYPYFHASDFEFHLPRPSYTIHTLDCLKKLIPIGNFISSSAQTTGKDSVVGANRNGLLPKINYLSIPVPDIP